MIWLKKMKLFGSRMFSIIPRKLTLRGQCGFSGLDGRRARAIIMSMRPSPTRPIRDLTYTLNADTQMNASMRRCQSPHEHRRPSSM